MTAKDRKQDKKTDVFRQCVVTRENYKISELVRFVVDPEGSVVPDLKKRLPGRGVWIKAEFDKIRLAVNKGIFQKGFRRSVSVPDNLALQVENLLRTSALQKFALANKSGLVITGFVKVNSAIGKKNIVGILHAKSASADSCNKLDKKFRNTLGDDGYILNCFEGSEMSKALGRENVVHVALFSGGASSSFLDAVELLDEYNRGNEAR